MERVCTLTLGTMALLVLGIVLVAGEVVTVQVEGTGHAATWSDGAT